MECFLHSKDRLMRWKDEISRFIYFCWGQKLTPRRSYFLLSRWFLLLQIKILIDFHRFIQSCHTSLQQDTICSLSVQLEMLEVFAWLSTYQVEGRQFKWRKSSWSLQAVAPKRNGNIESNGTYHCMVTFLLKTDSGMGRHASTWTSELSGAMHVRNSVKVLWKKYPAFSLDVCPSLPLNCDAGKIQADFCVPNVTDCIHDCDSDINFQAKK